MPKDAFYFTHDANARNDPKILAMRSIYKTEGYGWYFMILEIFREQEDYKLPLNKYTYDALAMQLQCERNAIEKFINDCCQEFTDKSGALLNKNDNFIWSDSFIRRMLITDVKREKARQSALQRWQNNEQSDDDTFDMRPHSEGYTKKERIKSKDINNITTEVCQKIVDKYNELCPSLPQVQRLTKIRIGHIKARIAELGDIEGLFEIFKKVEASDFLTKRKKISQNGHENWICNFDFIIGSEQNITKILEGKYDNNEPSNFKQQAGIPTSHDKDSEESWNKSTTKFEV